MKNLDTIEINLSIVEDEDYRGVDTQIILNGKEIKHFSDYTSFLFRSKDCAPLWEGDKQGEYSSFEVFTCSCGISGCAGIWDGIHTKHRKRTVEWRIPKDMGYTFLDKSFYSFSVENYESEIAKVWKWLCEHKDEVLKEEFCSDITIGDKMSWWKKRFPEECEWVEGLVRKYG